MVGLNTSDSSKLKLYIDKLERMEEEKKELVEQISDVLKQAKSDGFDTKIIKKVLSIRKVPKQDLLEQEELLDLYMHALGMRLSQD